MIVSTVAGRIRIRAKRLKSKKFSSHARDRIAELSGVFEVRANPGAGSLVVNYDVRETEATILEEQIETICLAVPERNDENGNGLSKTINKATKIGMVSTLAASLTYGYLGKKRPHIAYGTAFLGFAGLHMFKYANRLFR